MAYFAQVLENQVAAVHVVSDEIDNGGSFLADLFGGEPSDWVETYTDGRRGKQATIGDTYDPDLDEFVSPAAPPEPESD